MSTCFTIGPKIAQALRFPNANLGGKQAWNRVAGTWLRLVYCIVAGTLRVPSACNVARARRVRLLCRRHTECAYYRHEKSMKPILAFLALSLTLPLAARGEVYVLAGGGRISGELLNADESPRQKYTIKTDDGATVTIAFNQVQKVLPTRPNEAQYERIRPTYPDTVDGQWALAEWCREHRLPASMREPHLRRVIELDPNHVPARRALGYSRIDGRWTRPKELMEQRGLVNYHGQWKTPQEVELLERKHEQDLAQGEWMKKVKLWRAWIGGNRDQQARDNIRAVGDPAATKALAIALRDDKDTDVRLLVVETLSRLDTSDAAMALAIASIADHEDEVRQTCLDHLQSKKRPEVTSYYVKKLKDKSNETVNRAGLALGRMKDPAAVGPLIDALVTTHKFQIVTPGDNNSMNVGFGGGGGGLALGGRPKVIHKQLSNQSVLDALIAVTGRNFNFDKQAWKHWYAAQRKPAGPVDTRRDEKG
jgi:hypothetical protein